MESSTCEQTKSRNLQFLYLLLHYRQSRDSPALGLANCWSPNRQDFPKKIIGAVKTEVQNLNMNDNEFSYATIIHD